MATSQTSPPRSNGFNSTAIPTMFSSLTCQDITMIHSKGVWLNDNPLNYAAPLLMLQLSIISFISRAMELLFKPMGQPMIVPQILGGMILGPSLLRRNSAIPIRIFPSRSKTTLDTIASFGVMFFQFLVGAKMSAKTIIKSGKAAIVIGISVFVAPFVISLPITFAASYFMSVQGNLLRLVTVVASSQSITIFPIVWVLLAELKLLNSDIGHLATSSAIILDLCCWFNLAMFHTVNSDQPILSMTLFSFLSCLALVGFIVFVFRPAMIWIVKRTPDGQPVKEIYVVIILISVLVIAFISEVIGQHYVFGPFILGLAIPDGPPLGSALVDKLDHFISGMLFPIYFVVVGVRTNVYKIKAKTLEIVILVVIINSLGKITAAMFSCLYFKVPIRDALLMGIIMNANGITEIILYNTWRDVKILTDDSFSAVIVLVVLMTGSIAPLLRLFYDPAKRYAHYKRRNIQNMKNDTEFRILVCIHNQENAPTIINLLEASNATIESPVCVYALYLVELVGRVTPLLISHKHQRVPSSNGSTSSNRIFNAFHYYEQHNQGSVTVHPFTAVSPFVSMHNDVCLMASDKRVSLIIMPFHKQWAVDGTVESVNRAIRSMNRNVLDKAPCSVGIFIDRGILSGSRSVLSSLTTYNVAMLFLGGADDREALAYSARMAKHQSIRLTVVRFLTVNENNSEREKKFNGEAINAFRNNNSSNKQVSYREEMVKDGEGTTNVIRVMENSFDLMVVGRYHRKDTPQLCGLTEWNDCPELGLMGDLLASPDFMGSASVLVVQQQARVAGLGYQGNDMKDIAQGRDQNHYTVHDVPDDDDDDDRQGVISGDHHIGVKV